MNPNREKFKKVFVGIVIFDSFCSLVAQHICGLCSFLFWIFFLIQRFVLKIKHGILFEMSLIQSMCPSYKKTFALIRKDFVAVNRIHAKYSPVLMIQKWIRGFLIRLRYNYLMDTRLWYVYMFGLILKRLSKCFFRLFQSVFSRFL